MVKAKVIVFLLSLLPVIASAQEYEWKSAAMDGSRTGCTAVTKENQKQALGRLDNGNYIAPNGSVHKSSSAAAKVASVVMAAQPRMARVKEVIAYSEAEMPTMKKECPLSNWFVKIIMDKVSALSGRSVDVGIGNFGGIRLGMPEGEVILDDILSMFPFKNNVVYLELRGSDLRRIFEKMAATRFQAIGGVDILAENGRLVRANIGGQPIDDGKMYSVATISFLLYGGDSLTLAENAENMKIYDVAIVDVALEHLAHLSARGEKITAPDVRYVTVK